MTDSIGRISGADPVRRSATQKTAAAGFSDQLSAAKSGSALPALVRPVDGEVVKPFSDHHQGVDLAAQDGSPVKAAYPGVVESAGWAGDRGNMLVVRSESLRTYYGHLSAFQAFPGQQIEAGQLVADSGVTGAVQSAALHFEIHQGGAAVDPTSALA